MSKRDRTRQEFSDALERILNGSHTCEDLEETNGVIKITSGNVAKEAGKSLDSLNKNYSEIIVDIRKAKANVSKKGGSRPKTKAQIRIDSQQEEIAELKQDKLNLATENARYMVENDKLKQRVSELERNLKNKTRQI